MQIIADLQIHSKYSRAVSKAMVLPEIRKWAIKKGIGLIATGDWMHTIWFREVVSQLEEAEEGLYRVKPEYRREMEGARIEPGNTSGWVVDEPLFLLSAEISSIYTQGGKPRRVHTLIFAPNVAAAERINRELLARGCNLASDGRPIVGLSARDVAEIVLTVSDKCLVIPAHAWTPWFSLYGSKSGFDTIDECFGDIARSIWAVETGLSSDPAMNWRIRELERRAIVSFSDAHSGPKLGREATVFQFRHQPPATSRQPFSYDDIYWAIASRFLGKNEGKLEIAYTIEFYPEEGKYHYTGHRNCSVVQAPHETRSQGTTCHVCGKPLTVGVMHRVEELSRRGTSDTQPPEGERKPIEKKSDVGVVGYYHPTDETRPPYVMLVPLMEILGEVYEMGVGSKTVESEYHKLTTHFGGEFAVLLKANVAELRRVGGERLSDAVSRVRSGKITISPGYDGVFGTVRIWEEQGEKLTKTEQMGLF